MFFAGLRVVPNATSHIRVEGMLREFTEKAVKQSFHCLVVPTNAKTKLLIPVQCTLFDTNSRSLKKVSFVPLNLQSFHAGKYLFPTTKLT